jgi:CBS domain-containing protein
MLVREILRSKSPRLVTIAHTATLQKASEELARQGVGMLLVTGADGQLVGMLSERDFVCFASRRGHRAMELSVRDAMVQVTIAASPTSSVTDIMRIMTEQRARHLPVFDGATLVGVISLGDILHSRIAEKDLEAVVLRDLARTSLAIAA